MTGSHWYYPPGPLEGAPGGGYMPPQARLEAFADVLAGVPLGAYDEAIVQWLASIDDTTCRTVASLLGRCRTAGEAALRGRLAAVHAQVAAILCDEDEGLDLQGALEDIERELAAICGTDDES